MAAELSFDKEDSMRGYSFMDQCRIICLHYISKFSENVLLSSSVENEQVHNLNAISNKELAAFTQNDEYSDLIQYSNKFARNSYATTEEQTFMKDKLNNLKHSLNQKEYNDVMVACIGSAIVSWKQVAKIFNVAYTSALHFGDNNIANVIDLTVRFIHKHAEKFIESEGWKGCLIADYTNDISASMVVISKTQKELDSEQKAYEEGKFETSPPDTPPYTLVSIPATDDDRDSLATPPEIVEKADIMTDSQLQQIGAQFNINTEVVISENEQTDDADVPQEKPVAKPPMQDEKPPNFFWDNIPIISITVLAVSIGIAFFIIKRRV